MGVLWHFKEVCDTEMSEHPNLFIIYALSGVLHFSEYPVANHLVPTPCFLLAPETVVFLL